jgi:hypothetical protein
MVRSPSGGVNHWKSRTSEVRYYNRLTLAKRSKYDKKENGGSKQMLRINSKLAALLIIGGLALVGASVTAYAAGASAERTSVSPKRQTIDKEPDVQNVKGAETTEVKKENATDTATVKKLKKIEKGTAHEVKKGSKAVKKTEKTVAKEVKKPVKAVEKAEKKPAK